jgi:putative hydrolases of HD superfamily
MERILQQMAFIHEIDKVKYIQRKTRLFGSDRCENDAEHSWHLAMMTIVLAEHANEPLDVLKVLKMVLIHDIVEIDAGDIFLYDTTVSHTNTEAEHLAAERIFGLLPEEQAKDFIEIWDEFETGVSAEAKFARAMDRLEPLLQNFSNQGGTWKTYEVPFESVYHKKQVINNGASELWDFAQTILNQSVELGYLKKKPSDS